MPSQLKTCTKCANSKPLHEFNPSHANKDGLYSACRVCMAAYQADYRAARKAARNG